MERRQKPTVFAFSITGPSSCNWWVLRGSNSRHSPCKGDALPTELSTRRRAGIFRRGSLGACAGRPVRKSPLVYRILERFASPELRYARGLDLDRRPGARIAALPRGALSHVERTEPDQRDDIAFLQ